MPGVAPPQPLSRTRTVRCPFVAGPLWTDSFDVGPGEVWQVALRADNPGIWMSHCHDLEHAVQGVVLHLSYEGVASPFAVGAATGNHPE